MGLHDTAAFRRSSAALTLTLSQRERGQEQAGPWRFSKKSACADSQGFLPLPLGEGGGEGMGLHDTAAFRQSSAALTLTLPERGDKSRQALGAFPKSQLALIHRVFSLSQRERGQEQAGPWRFSKKSACADSLDFLPLPLGEGGGEGMGLHDTAAFRQSSAALTLTLSQREGTRAYCSSPRERGQDLMGLLDGRGKRPEWSDRVSRALVAIGL
jgi:hypothetical protein